MSRPPISVAPTPGIPLAARVEFVDALRASSDHTWPLAAVVHENLDHLWRHGGKIGAAAAGRQPRMIHVRRQLVYRVGDHRPLLPRLIKTRGLQLRLLLLLLFDAQCRHEPGRQVRTVRRIGSHADQTYQPWSRLVLAPTDTTVGTGRGPAQLRERQIREALRALETHNIVSVPRERGGARRRYDEFRLHSEESTPEESPPYTVSSDPATTFTIPPAFFTNLWVFALTDTELATYLVLWYLRSEYPGRHDHMGVFLTAESRQRDFGLTPATWRATQMLQRLGLITRVANDDDNEVFESFKQRWANRAVQPDRYRIIDQALGQPALETIHRTLTQPTLGDLLSLAPVGQ